MEENHLNNFNKLVNLALEKFKKLFIDDEKILELAAFELVAEHLIDPDLMFQVSNFHFLQHMLYNENALSSLQKVDFLCLSENTHSSFHTVFQFHKGMYYS